MARESYFQEGNWYKGNLHCHSTRSDGKTDPQDIILHYRDKGWDFITLTDHRVFNRDFTDTPGILVLPAMEADYQMMDKVKYYHFVAIGLPGDEEGGLGSLEKVVRDATAESEKEAQELIDFLLSKKCAVILAHPVWSRLNPEDIDCLHGYFATEVYNSTCNRLGGIADSSFLWDYMLQKGQNIFGVASDDTHLEATDAFRSFTMVKAGELTREGIVSALLKGQFYASNGPQILDYGIEDGKVYIECSPVKEIHFASYPTFGSSVLASEGQTITSASLPIRGKYIRVTCVDEYGKKAWTNPIFF